MNNEVKFLKDIVRQASDLITSDFEVKAKGNKGDLVTNLDMEIEKFLIGKIKENYPNFDIVSEEFNTTNAPTKNCFVIDPIDGTINFVSGLPLWGIQVACIKDGDTCASIIYLPKFNEMYWADETGAYLNGTKINVREQSLKSCLYSIDGADSVRCLQEMTKHSPHARKIMSASVNCAWIAKGIMDGCVVLNNNCWDYLPGQFLVMQAGGYICDTQGIHVVACNEEIAEALKESCVKCIVS